MRGEGGAVGMHVKTRLCSEGVPQTRQRRGHHKKTRRRCGHADTRQLLFSKQTVRLGETCGERKGG